MTTRHDREETQRNGRVGSPSVESVEPCRYGRQNTHAVLDAHPHPDIHFFF
jgi:hypothetical protein